MPGNYGTSSRTRIHFQEARLKRLDKYTQKAQAKLRAGKEDYPLTKLRHWLGP